MTSDIITNHDGSNRLVQYVSKRKDKKTGKYVGSRIGVIVAQVLPTDPSRVGIGWSKTKVGDTFNKEIGLQIATNRAALLSGVGMGGKRMESRVPDSLHEEVLVVYNRAKRYFKDKEVILPIVPTSEVFDENKSGIML